MNMQPEFDPRQLAREEIVEDGLLTVKAASDFLGIARSTLYELMERGKLSYVRVAGTRSRRIPKRALVAIAAEGLVWRT